MKPLRQPDGLNMWHGPVKPKHPMFCPALHGNNVHEVRQHGMNATGLCIVCGFDVDPEWPRNELDQFGGIHYVAGKTTSLTALDDPADDRFDPNIGSLYP